MYKLNELTRCSMSYRRSCPSWHSSKARTTMTGAPLEHCRQPPVPHGKGAIPCRGPRARSRWRSVAYDLQREARSWRCSGRGANTARSWQTPSCSSHRTVSYRTATAACWQTQGHKDQGTPWQPLQRTQRPHDGSQSTVL